MFEQFRFPIIPKFSLRNRILIPILALSLFAQSACAEGSQPQSRQDSAPIQTSPLTDCRTVEFGDTMFSIAGSMDRTVSVQPVYLDPNTGSRIGEGEKRVGLASEFSNIQGPSQLTDANGTPYIRKDEVCK